MNGSLSKLSPMERRFVVGVGVVVFIVLNVAFVWPHFGDWGDNKRRLARAHETITKFETEIANKPKYEAGVAELEKDSGASVPLENQPVDLSRAIISQAAASGLSLINNTRMPVRTNDQFFVEQAQSVTVQGTDRQLVTFLYNLGSGNSMIRVRDISIRPDPPHYQLNASIKLVASYQRTSAARGGAAASRTETSRR